MSIKTTGYGQTDIGKKRDNNEDCFLIDEQMGLYVVCDGMGGHAAGEIASREASRTFQEYLEDHFASLDGLRSEEDLKGVQDLVAEGVKHASRKVHDEGELAGHSGMGTTITLLLTVGDRAVIASVGDSRAYHCRKRHAQLLTQDHTLANEMLIAGQLTAEQARQSPFNHYLTRTVGAQEEVQVDTLVAHLVPGDVFLLCTDGLTRYFDTEQELGQFMLREPSRIPPELISYANESGGNDNVTAVIVHVEEAKTLRPTGSRWQNWFTRVAFC